MHCFWLSLNTRKIPSSGSFLVWMMSIRFGDVTTRLSKIRVPEAHQRFLCDPVSFVSLPMELMTAPKQKSVFTVMMSGPSYLPTCVPKPLRYFQTRFVSFSESEVCYHNNSDSHSRTLRRRNDTKEKARNDTALWSEELPTTMAGRA